MVTVTAFSTIRKSLVIKVLILLVVSLSLSGCLMRKMHYKSFTSLRQETAKNYSQQVLDAIVGVREHAELPVFFNVEAGNSTWTPRVTGTTGNVVLSRVRESLDIITGHTTTLSVTSPSATGQEAVSSSIQFNDFGSAAMSRISTLYAFLCYPVKFGEFILPHGALYTIVEESNSKENFILSSKIEEGRYMGVTKDRDVDFLRFANDVTYWSRHADPETKNLVSDPGILLRFTFEFPGKVVKIENAIRTREKFEAVVAKLGKELNSKREEYEKLKDEATVTKTDPLIMQTLLKIEQKGLESKIKVFTETTVQLAKTKAAIRDDTSDVKKLLYMLELTLLNIKEKGPTLDKFNITTFTSSLNKHLEQLLAGDKGVLEKMGLSLSLSEATGLGAQESRDDLYRERFESLPSRFDETFRSVD